MKSCILQSITMNCFDIFEWLIFCQVWSKAGKTDKYFVWAKDIPIKSIIAKLVVDVWMMILGRYRISSIFFQVYQCFSYLSGVFGSLID